MAESSDMPANQIYTKWNPEKDYVVEDIFSFIAAVKEICARFCSGSMLPCWRGHQSMRWRLVPSLYREGLSRQEPGMYNEFMRMAKIRHEHCPPDSDRKGWLFLMQHYRLPTRLLDWSESPLVALFFAVENHDERDEDAVVWGLHLNGLSYRQYVSSAPELVRETSDTLVEQAFSTPEEKDRVKVAMGIKARQVDARHIMQQAAFTIHGCDMPIEELPDIDDCLARIRIDRQTSGHFRKELKFLGISRANLFPDLENLAAHVTGMAMIDAIAGYMGLGDGAFDS